MPQITTLLTSVFEQVDFEIVRLDEGDAAVRAEVAARHLDADVLVEDVGLELAVGDEAPAALFAGEATVVFVDALKMSANCLPRSCKYQSYVPCLTMCTFSCGWVRKVFPQSSHSNGFTPSWILLWADSPEGSLNSFLHSGHSNCKGHHKILIRSLAEPQILPYFLPFCGRCAQSVLLGRV